MKKIFLLFLLTFSLFFLLSCLSGENKEKTSTVDVDELNLEEDIDLTGDNNVANNEANNEGTTINNNTGNVNTGNNNKGGNKKFTGSKKDTFDEKGKEGGNDYTLDLENDLESEVKKTGDKVDDNLIENNSVDKDESSTITGGININDHLTQDGSVNFTSLYGTYIQKNIGNIVGNSTNTGNNFEVNSIEWVGANTAKVNYEDDNNNSYELKIEMGYGDNGVVVLNSNSYIKSEKDQSNGENNSSSNENEDNNQENGDKKEDSDNGNLDEYGINIDNHLTEDGNINYTSLYGTFIMENIGEISEREVQGNIKNVKIVGWVDGNTARVRYEDKQNTYLSDIKVSYKDNNIKVIDYTKVDN